MAEVDPLESAFRDILRDADLFPDQVQQWGGEGKPDEAVEGGAFPEATALRMQTQVAVQMRGIGWLLSSPQVAHVSAHLLRGMIEAFTHLVFIYAKGQASEWPCRAACLELGMAKELQNLVAKAGTAAPDEQINSLRDEAAYRLAHVEAFRKEHKCKCKGRGYGNVMDTLKEMSSDKNLDWLRPAWATTAAVSHQLLPDHYMREIGPSASGFLPVPLIERAARMEQALTIFEGCAAIFLAIVDASDKLPLLQAGIGTLKSRLRSLMASIEDEC